ncbi:hypothetical protein Tco_0251916 [Tanacetum coccineum]
MSPQEIQLVVARDEQWVPSAERVKISSTNIRLETAVPQKEETLQVVIDIIKNSTCFRAFTISADILEIFMQTILDICPTVEGVDFTDVPNDDAALTFLIDLSYKGPLNRHTNMFVDHMHRPWRTLAAIINKCLSRKTTSNDKLKKSRIDILWGMFNRVNVNYPALIWEDIAYQIDHRKEKRSRRENMPYPRFTKIIINHFLKQHKSFTNLNHKHYPTIKDDGIVSWLKFIRIGEDYQEYGHYIPNVMLTDAIKHSKSYQMFIKYSTHQIPPKKSRGKGSQGKKTADTLVEDLPFKKKDTLVEEVKVSEEFDPKLAKRKTSSKRRVKKKVTLSADDNIIYDDPDAALELAKSISQTEAEEAEAARKVHDTHARIVTESISEYAKKKSRGRSSKSVIIQDTLSTPKSKPATSKAKLKGVPSLTPEEQEAADIKQALKESKKTSRRKPGTGGSNEGTGSIPGVLDESTVVFATLSKGTGDKDDDNDDVDKDDKDGDADEKGDDHVSGTQDADDEDVKTESDDDDIYKHKIHVIDTAKEEAEKTSEAKDDTKKTELPPASSSLSVSSGFGDQFLKLSSDSSLVSTVKDSAYTDVSSLLDIPIQQETPQTQSPYVQKVPVSVIPKTTILPPIPEIVTETPVSIVVSSSQVTPIIS